MFVQALLPSSLGGLPNHAGLGSDTASLASGIFLNSAIALVILLQTGSADLVACVLVRVRELVCTPGMLLVARVVAVVASKQFVCVHLSKSEMQRKMKIRG